MVSESGLGEGCPAKFTGGVGWEPCLRAVCTAAVHWFSAKCIGGMSGPGSGLCVEALRDEAERQKGKPGRKATVRTDGTSPPRMGVPSHSDCAKQNYMV